MTREIKFRAWDKERKIIEVLNPESVGYYLGDSPNYKLMQFTGLHDKNGKEIYEGDIVKFHWFGFNGSETDNDGIGTIVYGNPYDMSFSISSEGNGDFLINDTSHYEEPCIEIIGNIYENPELLTTQTNDR